MVHTACIDPESADLLTGGFNVWVRTGWNLIDYLFDCLAGAKSVTRLTDKQKSRHVSVFPMVQTTKRRAIRLRVFYILKKWSKTIGSE